MILPTATYRLQLREGMDFARARNLVPYLRDLGIGALYLAPVFRAASGSTHGYDVTDPNAVEPSLGGREGLEALAAACHDAGLRVVIDIVPNHTAFTVENPWLRDVLRHGRDSRYAGHFDIFWDQGRLRLPWLGKPFADALAEGEVGVEEAEDGPAMTVPGLSIPLAVDGPGDDLAALHDRQPWRLTHWRTEAAAITHRRFFTVTSLIGMRVEDEAVFADMHRLTFDLVDAGVVDGLRIDHVDGLADPAGYLARLRARLPDTPVWIEKILTGDEPLPPDWAVEGPTGYEAAVRIGQALTDEAGAHALAERAAPVPFRAVLDAAKRQIVAEELAAELDQATAMFAAAAPRTEWGREALRAALIEYLCAFPRYRSYATADAVPDADAALIRDTAARAGVDLPDPGALPLLADVLVSPEGAALRLRLQQVTGAAIAKSQEDTAFYRYVPLLSANEVGAEPDEPALEPEGFHAAMAARAAATPHALTLTSSHDTKRSEDARARIMALSHEPGAFDALIALVPDDVPTAWRWYLAQSAFAAQPAGDLPDRLAAHAEKAMREAKADTFWTAPNAAFEGRVTAAARGAAAAMEPLPERLAGLAARGARLAIAQAALKLTVPGIPDIYQGTEVGSHLLTDPDNRRAVDFDRLAAALGDPSALTPFDAAKLSLTATLLRLRRDAPDLFLRGDYAPAEAPAGVLAFERRHDGSGVRVTVSTVGDVLEGPGSVWPPADLGPQAARVDRV